MLKFHKLERSVGEMEPHYVVLGCPAQKLHLEVGVF